MNPMSFRTAFGDFVESDGFDAIVGNPPYVFTRDVDFGSSIKDYYQQKYFGSIDKSVRSRGNQTGKVNLYGIFIIRALKLLNSRGLFGYIVPNTILRTTVYEGVRKYMLDNCSIEQIVDLKSGVFKGVTASTVMLLLGLRKQKDTVRIIDNPKDMGSIISTHQQASKNSFKSNPSYAFNIFVDTEKAAVFSSILERSLPLSELIDVFNGIATYRGKQGIGKVKLDNTFKKLLLGRNIRRYFHEWGGEYIEYNPAKLQRARNESIFLADEKLIMQRVGGILVTSYDDEKYYTFNSVNNLIPKESEYSLKFVLACLNSEFLRGYYSTNFTNRSSLTVNISKTFLDQLPIPVLDFSIESNVIAHNRVVALVEDIIAAKRNMFVALTDKDKSYYERKITDLDRNINEEITALYGLSRRDIETISVRNEEV